MPIVIGKPQRTDKYFGEKNVPVDVLRRRKSVYDMMRRMGTPILVKHRYSDFDFQQGTVKKSVVYDDIYGQTREEDPLSHGVGYTSLEDSPNEWYDTVGDGTIVVSKTKPGSTYIKAPYYRGFGPGKLTYIIEPDRAEDYFKASTGGPLFKIMQAMAIAPWYPDINDNDLLISVVLDGAGKVVKTLERYEAKQASPISMHGLDRSGRREYSEAGGNRFVVNQQFEMVLIPHNTEYYKVEADR